MRDRLEYLRTQLPLETAILILLIGSTFWLGSVNPTAWFVAWGAAAFINFGFSFQDKAKPLLACAIAASAIGMLRTVLFFDLRGTDLAGQALISALLAAVPAVMLGLNHKKWIAIVSMVLIAVPVLDHVYAAPPDLYSTPIGRFFLGELVLRVGTLALIGIALARWSQFTKEPEQGVAPQSATRSEADSEGGDKPQPESEARSR